MLLVEDEESAAEVLATILELEGFDVTLPPNGKRAIETLEDVAARANYHRLYDADDGWNRNGKGHSYDSGI